MSGEELRAAQDQRADMLRDLVNGAHRYRGRMSKVTESDWRTILATIEAERDAPTGAAPSTPEPSGPVDDCGLMKHVGSQHFMDEPCTRDDDYRCTFEPYRSPALAAPSTEPALDVERLAEAIVLAVRAERAPIGYKGDGWPAYWEKDHPATVLVVSDLAKRLAAEYARLAESQS